MTQAIQTIRHYHEQTKHRLEAYAKGPEYLDWEQQPDPFRRFTASPLLELPFLADKITDNQKNSFSRLDLSCVAALLELSMGLSSWKQFGPDRWALRCNPSSGNLHPTEAYIIATHIDDLENGVYHYAPHEHALELRGTFSDSDPNAQLLVGLTSIFWREAWKYGERAFRYVQLDVGHAIGAIRYAAKALGLQITLLSLADSTISKTLGLNREADFLQAEAEHPDIILQIELADRNFSPVRLADIKSWHGKANSLGGFPNYHWDIIDQVASACCSDPSLNTKTIAHRSSELSQNNRLNEPLFLKQMIQQRRSAQAFRGKDTSINISDFYRLLESLLAEAQQNSWDIWPFPIRIHLVFFVHRVSGLAPGLYVLPRKTAIKESMQLAMDADFDWQKPADCPEHIPLFQLRHADARKAARTLSCHQEIASSSAFSLSMLGEFDTALADGAHVYKHLYWEAGLLGQTLYLQAEAMAQRGTGIGCFFDDSMHELLAFKDTQFQSLYHFTIGTPKVDERLETLAPYSHLPKERLNNGSNKTTG